jgi:hypothetical protein
MNTQLRTIVLSCLVILALMGTLFVGCGKKGREAKVTITIGNISDMTGPASSALVPINILLQDIVNYYNDNQIIPGVRFKVVSYDARYDPSLDIPAYDWVRSKGAQVIYSALPTTGEDLKIFVDRDNVPMWELTATTTMIDPPGWIFCPNIPFKWDMKTLLKWISENDWDYTAEGRVPKIGEVGWNEPATIPYAEALKEYCQDHPDQFQYVGSLLEPVGATSWTSEVSKLKDCDYVYPPETGTGLITFIRQYLDIGGKAKFIGGNAAAAYRNLLVDAFGYDTLDGMIFNLCTGRWWNEADTDPQVKLALELLSEYQSKSEADSIIYAGGLIGSFHEDYALFQILEQTIRNVGAENFSGQDFYDTAINFSANWESYETWNFTANKRYMPNDSLIYKWSAADKDLVVVSDWIPVLMEGSL